jgi:hypothetical protein
MNALGNAPDDSLENVRMVRFFHEYDTLLRQVEHTPPLTRTVTDSIGAFKLTFARVDSVLLFGYAELEDQPTYYTEKLMRAATDTGYILHMGGEQCVGPPPRSVVGPASDSAPAISLTSDSTAPSPWIQSESGRAVVHVPPEMLTVLYDTLPGFVPFPPWAYNAQVLVGWRDETPPAAPLSVAVGDFDGDGRADLAMIGNFRDSTARILLVSNRQTGTGPRLVFLGPRWPAVRMGDNDTYLRRADRSVLQRDADGVEEITEGKGAVIFYLDHGTLRMVQTSD